VEKVSAELHELLDGQHAVAVLIDGQEGDFGIAVRQAETVEEQLEFGDGNLPGMILVDGLKQKGQEAMDLLLQVLGCHHMMHVLQILFHSNQIVGRNFAPIRLPSVLKAQEDG